MTQELIRLDGLCKYYTGAQSVVMGLNHVDLTLRRGEFVAITGESGSGKSTLSHVLSGILPYEGGELYLEGEPTSHYDGADWERYRRDKISFISQKYGILPGATVLENVVSALLLAGFDKEQAHNAAKDLLNKVELWELRDRRAAKLSSGQKQRLSIARALSKPAPILIADEPTGNLDPENSAKVIALLAQAAKERLVILVTHEFTEAEDCATRHIVLQEGRVVMDADLRPLSEVTPDTKRKSGKRNVGAYVARLQMKSRPVWSGILALFFAMTAFAVFAFLGTFFVHLDDSSTRVYDPSVFKNGDPTRIVAVTVDGSPMTEEDLQALANLPYVQSVEPNGYVTDIQYAYRENVDYELVTYETSTAGPDGLPVTEVHIYAKLRSGAPYLRTVPVIGTGKTFLSAGREPENFYEVIASGDESLLGQTITVYLTNRDYWPVDQTLKLSMEVVGVTDQGSGLYFHEDVGRFFVQISKTATGGYTFIPSEELDDNHFRAHWDAISGMLSQYDRARKELGRNQKLGNLQIREVKTFDNINFVSYSDDPVVEDISLELVSTELGGYHLWHLVGMRYIYFDRYQNIWISSEGATTVSGPEYRVEFYPVDGTELTEDGTLTSGRYVIWNRESMVALSGLAGATKPSSLTYAAVPVELEGDTLSGYTDDEIWDVTVVRGQIASITHDGSNLGSRKGSAGTEYGSYWVVENAVVPTGTHEYPQPRLIEVSYDRFDELTWNTGSEQVSLTIADYAYTQRVLASVQDLGFAALSPYQLGSMKQDPDLAQERQQTLMICLLALAGVVVLQMVLLRVMFAAQMDSYRLLRDIGLSARMARRSVLWQILGFALLGQMLSIGALVVCWQKGIERIVYIIRYLPVSLMLLLMAVHMAVSVAAAFWIRRALNRQVYALTGRESDLPMDDGEEDAE